VRGSPRRVSKACPHTARRVELVPCRMTAGVSSRHRGANPRCEVVRCVACGLVLGLGPSRDDTPAVMAEIWAVELESAERQDPPDRSDAWMAVASDADNQGWHDHREGLAPGEDTRGDRRPGWLAREIFPVHLPVHLPHGVRPIRSLGGARTRPVGRGSVVSPATRDAATPRLP